MGRRLLATLGAGVAAAVVVFAVLPGEDEAGEPVVRSSAAPPRGPAVFAAMGCGSCHRLAAAGSSGEIGPDLDAVLGRHTAESLRAVIVDPPPSAMPDTFGRRMSARELDALVAFLLAGRDLR